MSDLRATAAQLGIQDNVEFLGHVDQVETVLARSKVFVLTSRSEGLSIALAEAMAAGVVPVVADVGDLSELVQEGRTGWLVPPGDLDRHSERIHELLVTSDLWKETSRSARQAAIALNDVHNVANRWARTIENACGRPERFQAPFQMPLRKRRILALPSRWQVWDRLPGRVKRRLQAVAGLVPPEWCLGSRYQATTRLLEEADRWPRDVTEAYTVAHLRRICRWAERKSPFYRRAFAEAGFSVNELRSPEDLRNLPFIDKDTLRGHLEEMCAVPTTAPGVDRVSTGGTSGVPLTFYIGAERSGIEYAHLVHAWRRAGYTPRTAQAVLRGRAVAPETHEFHHEFDPILRRHYYSSFHMTDANLRHYWNHMATIGPCFLHVYPSSLDRLVRFVERSAAPAVRNVLGILAGSEIVYEGQRERAERVLGVRYFSWYGHSEKLVFAAECEHTHDYHVYPTYGFLELLDEDGRPVATPGQRGEIVGTGFINTVVPFIRYRTGDFATYVGDRCEGCGRRQIILRDIRGHRTQEMLVGRDGGLIPWTALNMHDDTFNHVRRFQFVQSEPGRATLRVIPTPEFNDADRQRIHRNLDRKLSGNLSVVIETCDHIPLTRMGKATYVDQRIDWNEATFAGVGAP
jgi:phenylacetate-CoA ligase